jgi:transposase
VRQRPEEFAEGARRPSHALPDAAVVDREPGEEKPGLAELREVSRDQSPPLLPLAALRGEAGGHLAHMFQNSTGIHHCTLLSADASAARDLLRRRMHLMRKRAELLAHIQNTNSQYNIPEIGKKIAYKTNRAGVAERFPDPAVQKSIEVDLALIDHYDQLLRDVELSILNTAKQHKANTLYLLRTVPGIAEILSLVLLDESHDIQRFPRVQEFVSSCRLVKCAKESAGKRYGTSGTKIGTAYLKWACSEAAVLFLRTNPAGQKYLARLEKQHGKGKALTVLAHKLARAVYHMLKRATASDIQMFLQS